MSVTMEGYVMSDPAHACQDMDERDKYNQFCPLCKRSAKWYYNFYVPKSEQDSEFRCTLHPISPIPGPRDYPDRRKVVQLY